MPHYDCNRPDGRVEIEEHGEVASREEMPKVSGFVVDNQPDLRVVVGDTQSDSIQRLNFAKKTIHSIFDSILLYPRFNSKYSLIQKIFC